MPELSIQWHNKQFRTDCQHDIIVRLLNAMIWFSRIGILISHEKQDWIPMQGGAINQMGFGN
jgi:hypothetical protein